MTAYECRVGHAFSAEQLWIAHCKRRNQTLMTAERSLAENAALARDLAELGRVMGRESVAARLEDEAATEEGYLKQVRAMLADLAPGEPAASA
jgi:two-component system chemotaxis response regulator CheB